MIHNGFNKKLFILLSVSCIVYSFPFRAYAVPQRAPEVQLIDPVTHEVRNSFLAFGEEYQGGVQVATGDVDGDGKIEYIVGQSGGHDARGVVRIFSDTFALEREFIAFPEGAYQAELDIAVGDLNNDGADEIVASLPQGKKTLIHIFSGDGKIEDKTSIVEAFPGENTGSSVAIGNVIGDDDAEIIVGSGQGIASRVRILDANGKSIGPDIVPFADFDTQGVNVSTVNTSGGDYEEVIVSFKNGGRTWVKSYRIDSEQTYPILAEFEVWSREFKSGVETTAIDIDHNGTQEIAVAPAGDQRAEVRFFQGDGTAISGNTVYPYEEEFRGGLNITGTYMHSDSPEVVVVAPSQQRKHADPNRAAKYIEVDLSDQITYLWEDGYLRNVYLISSGLPATPSPQGEWQILKKIESHVYDGRPVYYFPNTPWNLRYKNGGPEGNYYFHTAYWHNSFGRPKSHGCINMREPDAKFLYFWADIGTPAWIHQ